MDDCPELLLKKLCCTCLSQDRKLTQLCRLTEGINNLYFLLSYDTEAYREGFYKDTAHWFICWECWAVVTRITRFRNQVCAAQRRLADLLDERTDIKLFNVCFSRLSTSHKAGYDETFQPLQGDDNFVDCGVDIKEESDEDLPLSELHSSYNTDDRNYSDTTQDRDKHNKKIPVYKKRKNKCTKKKEKNVKKIKPKADDNTVNFMTKMLTEEEMREFRERRKMVASFADAKYKCESCIEGFKSQIHMDGHVKEFHTEKENHVRCDICLSYTPQSCLAEHRTAHYCVGECRVCGAVGGVTEIERHVIEHESTVGGRKAPRKTSRTVNPGTKPRRSLAMRDKRTPFGYKCVECDKYFENKNLRWKHVQKSHREGFKCSTCDKRFAFKNNLTRHELGHQGPLPRVPCAQCGKRVRADLAPAHARTHAARPRACALCDKRFASSASYEHHLKYTSRHANTTPNKYKCSMCDKGYRSRGELRDHVNYQHMGKTQHKCPICGKALATPRCITRHVRRAHDGVKEQARDKVCQQCGKAFREKKTLREHEFIHTGERPLSCEICGCTFRQSASLYTHRKRVHKIFTPQKKVQLIEDNEKEP